MQKLALSSQFNCSSSSTEETTLIFFKYFTFIGVPYPLGRKSNYARCLEKVVFLFFHLLSIYFPLLILCHLMNDGLKRHKMVNGIQSVFSALIRYHLISKGGDILEGMKQIDAFHSKLIPSPTKDWKRHVHAAGCFSILMALTMTVYAFIPLTKCDKLLSFMTLTDTPCDSLFIVPIVISFIGGRCFMIMAGPTLSVFFHCFIYLKLEGLINSFSMKTDIQKGKSDPRFLRHLAADLKDLSEVVIGLDRVLSPGTFCLLDLFLFQLLSLLTLIGMDEANLPNKILGGFMGLGVISGLSALVVSGSRVHEAFARIETAIVKSNEGLDFSDPPSGVNRLVLCQLVKTLSRRVYMTALGVFKIEKRLLITAVCVFLTYSVLIMQSFDD